MLTKLTASAVVTAAAIFLLATPAAQAQVLYDNGPINGNVDAWTVNFGFQVADSFTLGGASTLTGLNFGVWNVPGDTTSQIDWSIVTSPTGGSTLASGTASVTSVLQFTNQYGYNIALDTIALNNLALAAGTYWIELQNASAGNGDPIYWDINGGPSQIWESGLGYNPDPSQYAPGLNNASTAFQILGTSDVPEPASLAILAAGLLGLTSFRRRRQA
jgi:opacity protein-like surface antigen